MTGSWQRDATWCRPGNGDWLAGGVPRRLWRLGAAGRRVAEALERGDDPPPGHEPLTRRLVAAGALHPAPAAQPVTSVSVVIPTLNPAPADLTRLVTRIRRTAGDGVAIVVVDDASNPPVVAPEGVTVVRHEQRTGPGGARNSGLARVDTEFVALLDDDVDLPEGWLARVAGHLADASVGAVAPRVVGPAPGEATTWWERSDQVRSPLDLGPQAGPVRPGGRVPYVPSAALVVRRRAVHDVEGFDPELRFGEDVDLVWRLHRAGWQVRYEPGVEVAHRARATAAAWVRQRFHYGTSAAVLACRHPGAVVAVRLTAAQRAALAVAVLRPRWGAVATGAVTLRSIVALHRVLRRRGVEGAAPWALRWAVAGQLSTLRQVASALWRPWWPLTLLAAITLRRSRPLVVAATVLVTADDLGWWRRRRALDPVRFTLGSRLGDLAYGAGVWWGARTHRWWEPLRIGSALPDRVTST